MAKPKEERNRQFIRDWKEEGLSNEELQEKFDLSPGGVKGLKARLRKKDPSLYVGPQESTRGAKKKQANKSPSPQVDKVIKQQVDKYTSPLVHNRATYYLNPETIKTIKQIALDRNTDASGIVREILSKYLKKINKGG